MCKSPRRRTPHDALSRSQRLPPRQATQPASSRLQATSACSGQFAVTAELGPPRGASVGAIRRKAQLLRDWIDAANVTDGQSAVARMASWAGCMVAMQEGVEPVMQLQCRDRNRIALQADLLGAAAHGHPERAAADRRPPALRRPPGRQGRLRHGLDPARLDGAHDARSEAAAHRPRAVARRRRGSSAPSRIRSRRRSASAPSGSARRSPPARSSSRRSSSSTLASSRAGCSRCATSASTSAAASWRASARSGRCGRSSTCAARCPACTCPTTSCSRLRGVPADRVQDEGLALCAEIIQQVREIPGVAGVHVMAFGWEDAIPEILNAPASASGSPLDRRTAVEH